MRDGVGDVDGNGASMGYLFVGVKAVTYILCSSDRRDERGQRFKGSPASPPHASPLQRCSGSMQHTAHGIQHFNFPVVGNCLARPLGPSCRICPGERAMISYPAFLPVVIAFGGHFSRRRGNVPASQAFSQPDIC